MFGRSTTPPGTPGPPGPPGPPAPHRLDEQQLVDWRAALGLWGVTLDDPVVEVHPGGATFAWFDFPPRVHVDPATLEAMVGPGFLTSVLAHEIGHHVLSPSTRADSLRIRHQMARVLEVLRPRDPVSLEDVGLLANLWSDLIINVRVARLQRQREPDAEPEMVRLNRALADFGTRARDGSGEPGSPMWWVIWRCYERLWSLPPGTLCSATPPDRWRDDLDAELAQARALAQVPERQIRVSVAPRFVEQERRLELARRARRVVELEDDPVRRLLPEVDAMLLADTVRTLATDPVSGALPAGMVLAPYLLLDRAARDAGRSRAGDPVTCRDESGGPASAGELAGVIGDPRLSAPIVHPGLVAATTGKGDPTPASDEVQSQGQSLGVAATLALYAGSDADAVMAAWYEAEARAHVAPLVQHGLAGPASELRGPYETWDIGDDLGEVDWPATLAASPVVVPGVTTRRRTDLQDEPLPEPEPVRLDLYIDSSGSMARPEQGSTGVLAGTILGLSVLRGGGRVRVTSWSGPGQVAGDSAYTRDRVELMRQLTTYFGGGTTFPLDLLADRYLRDGARVPAGEVRHLVVLSDDGLTSLFGRGQEQHADVAGRVRRVLDTATLLVAVPPRWRDAGLAEQARAEGYRMIAVPDMADAPAACAELAAEISGYRRTATTTRRRRG